VLAWVAVMSSRQNCMDETRILTLYNHFWLLQALLSAFVFGFHVHEKAILTVGLTNLLFSHLHPLIRCSAA
jgi:hypothetical protein